MALFLAGQPVQAQSPAPRRSAPLRADSAGAGSANIASSVFRILCKDNGIYGTGFLHKSGNIITAGHVIQGCQHVAIALPDNKTLVDATPLKVDAVRDVALLKPETAITGHALRISASSTLTAGSELAFWGFPAGYLGVPPILSVGYLSGVDPVPVGPGKFQNQWVVNAAINHGNSGGPVILVESGEVIGVADNKVTPLSDNAMQALSALENQNAGTKYPATLPDGTVRNYSEAQLVAMVLEELRQQVQIGIGHAVMLGDLRAFLTESGVDP
jgi:S1-C subfamily serine protease